VIDVTDPKHPLPIDDNRVALANGQRIYLARTYAYVASGREGLAIVDIERPEHMRLDQLFNAGGRLSDTRDVVVASTNASLFAYVADGAAGLKVLQLTSPGEPAEVLWLQSGPEAGADCVLPHPVTRAIVIEGSRPRSRRR